MAPDNISTLRKLKLAGDIATRGARRNRLISAGWNATRLSARHTAIVLRKLWLEVTGFVFMAFAVLGAVAGYRAYHAYLTHAPNSGQRVLAACLFTLAFAWFGVSSMWLSRRAPKSKTGAKMTGAKR